MSEDRNSEHMVEALGELADRVVRLAEALEVAEVEAALIRAECERLGVAGRFATYLEDLEIPSGAAEHLQDELDRLSGELHRSPHRGVHIAGGPLPRLHDRHPTREHVAVTCPSCGAHNRLPAVTAAAFEEADLDERTYECGRCGHRDTFETWDHYLEGDDAGGESQEP